MSTILQPYRLVQYDADICKKQLTAHHTVVCNLQHNVLGDLIWPMLNSDQNLPSAQMLDSDQNLASVLRAPPAADSSSDQKLR